MEMGEVESPLLHQGAIAALTIIGGLILLLLALNIILGSHSGGEGAEHRDPLSIAISPLAIPLMPNPLGIVAQVVLSASATDMVVAEVIIVMLLVIALFDLSALSVSDRFAAYLSTAAVESLEKILGIFLGALAVQILLDGLTNPGVTTLSGGHKDVNDKPVLNLGQYEFL
jgi:multiple antibiotic resistance protein